MTDAAAPPTAALRAVTGVVLLSALGMVLGYARDAGLAAVFGASRVTDAFFVATLIPMSVGAVVMSGTLAPALLPVFAQCLHVPGRAWEMANVILTLAAIASVFLYGGMLISAPSLVNWLAPGLDAQGAALATQLVVLTAPILGLLGISALLGALANALGSFRLPALSPLLMNGVAFVSIVLLGARWGIQVAALGLVLGALVQVILQIIALYRSGWRYGPALAVRQPAVKQVCRLFVPLAAFVALAQAVPLVERAVGSAFPSGQLSLLVYAAKFYQIPGVVLTSSLVVVLYPILAHHQAGGDTARFLTTLRGGLRQCMFLSLPVILWFWLLAPPFVRLIFERGAFTPADSLETARLLRWYTLGVIPAALLLVLTRAFHARRDMVTPLWLGLLNTAVYVMAALLLTRPLGLDGLPLAFALSQVTGCALYAMVLARQLDVQVRDLFDRESAKLVGPGLALLIVVAVGIRVGDTWLTGAPDLPSALVVGISIALSAFVYLVTARLVGLNDALLYFDPLKRRPSCAGNPRT